MDEKNDDNIYRVHRTGPVPRVKNMNTPPVDGNPGERHGHGHEEQPENPGTVEDHVREVENIVDFANRQLGNAASAYRFSLVLDKGQVFIDIIIVDAAGNILEVKERNITHSDIFSTLQRILEGEGLLFDRKG